ncbi:uncharacterized protein LOC121835424 [Ixodes scapularis]|uniref:uncharacterized protein LOC121835424 n=1 Tax=Ixodes scapularis TaxID=6945 RepID=UPI001C38A85E|nr:uncharacterized protein LOC121835424 [Ixodes scapularis]
MALLRLRLRSLGLHIRKGIPHPGVEAMLGFFCHNWASNYRLMQISRKEVSRQLRLMETILPQQMTIIFGPGYGTHPSFRFLQKAASNLLESSWKKVVTGVTTFHHKTPQTKLEPPVVLCDHQLSSGTLDLLSKGPKFSPNLPTTRVDQLTSVHSVATHIPEQDRQAFLDAGVRSACAHAPPPTGKVPIRATVEELQRSHLKLLESDKTGVFVILDEGSYGQKVSQALKKNFDTLKTRPSGSLRSKAKQLCCSLNLPALKAAIGAPSKQYLTVFFTAKTHKEGVPLRSIISEKGCWQKPLGLFLQKHLSSISLNQPFRVANSTELVSRLHDLHSTPEAFTMFSLDIEELYYRLDPTFLMDSVSSAIHEHGPCDFQNSSGVSERGFLDLLALYLQSTLVEHGKEILRQKKGVCIGSCLAPVLSEIFLTYVDREIEARLEELSLVFHVFRYVDDYLVIHPISVSSDSVVQAFTSSSSGLNFTREDSSGDGLQYLNLRLHLLPTGICWAFQQRSRKPILPFCSSHSKLVKHGIIRSLLSSSRTKSCSHFASFSIAKQQERLLRAGYPQGLLSTILVQLILTTQRPRAPRSKPSRVICIPYVHNSAHRLKAIAARFNVSVVFSCKLRLKQLCRRVNNNESIKRCSIKHAHQTVPCEEGVVYSIPLSCGDRYIGQTGRCLNTRLREHVLEVSRASDDTFHPIVVHQRLCTNCEARFQDTCTIGRHKNKLGREIIEAYKIAHDDHNIAAPSLALSRNEINYLKPELD